VSFSLTIGTLIERMPHRPYCADRLSEGVRVRKKEAAIGNKYIQINTPATVQAFCIDIDNEYAFEAHTEANVPPPSIFVQNTQNGHGHSIYMIKTPVCISPKAKIPPQRWFAGIARGYTRRLGGDQGYSGLLCRNPLKHHIIDYKRLYSLSELDDCLDFEDKAPYYESSKEVGVGRNVTMFDQVRTWAYRAVVNYDSYRAFNDNILFKCREINAGFRFPLSDSEPRATAKSIAKWVWKNRFEFSDKKINRGAYGSTRQEAGVITASRIQMANEIKIQTAISDINKAGMKPTAARIAALAGVSKKTVYNWINRAKKT